MCLEQGQFLLAMICRRKPRGKPGQGEAGSQWWSGWKCLTNMQWARGFLCLKVDCLCPASNVQMARNLGNMCTNVCTQLQNSLSLCCHSLFCCHFQIIHVNGLRFGIGDLLTWGGGGGGVHTRLIKISVLFNLLCVLPWKWVPNLFEETD